MFEKPFERAMQDYGMEDPNQPSSGVSAGRDYGSMWKDSSVVQDWANNVDTYGHNEALAAYEREAKGAAEAFARESDFNAQEAEKQREWEKMMSDTAFQRKVADYVKAGFSPLAALDGAVGASTPSGSSATATAKNPNATPGGRGSNNFGSIIGSVIAAFALIMTKGISAGVSMKTASAAAAAAEAKQISDYMQRFQELREKAGYAEHLERTKKALGHRAYR